MKQLLATSRALTPQMFSLLRELVEIESPSTDAAGVERVARHLARQLSAIGLAPELLPVAGAGPVLRARSAAPAGARPVMLLGHLDTVWPKGTLASRPVRTEGDLLYGPGSFDMKAGLVVAVFALRHLAAAGPLPAVTVFFTPREEIDCEPYRALMEREMRASSAVLGFEPAWPGGAVKTGRKGSGSFLLRARGRAAHAGADPTQGANAILDLSRRVLEASALSDAQGGVTVTVGVFRGGIASNVVPDLAEAELDVRYTTAENGRLAQEAIRSLRASEPGVTLEIEGGLHYPPLERGPQVLGLFAKARAVAAQMGLDLAETVTGGSSEASFASALGIPTLDGLGADGDGAHAEDERVLIPSLAERAALAAGLIRALTGPA